MKITLSLLFSLVTLLARSQDSPVVQQTGNVTHTTTTTTQTDDVNVGVNVGGASIGISINDTMGGNVSQTTTTTTTRSSTVVYDQVTESPRGCVRNSCMAPRNFSEALSTIEKQSFEETQLKTAKQVTAVNCLSVDQIMQIANTFNFEDNKLEYAKYAYEFCTEPKNYFKLNEIFSFSSNVDVLSDYVQSRQ